jgi:hypothetical protein
MAEAAPSGMPLNIVPQPEPDFSEQPAASGIPGGLWWLLLGLSALILLIQIWTYFS